MSATASEITGVSTVCSTVCWGTDQRKHQSFASLSFMKGIHWIPETCGSPHKGPITRKMFPLTASKSTNQGRGCPWGLFSQTKKSSSLLTFNFTDNRIFNTLVSEQNGCHVADDIFWLICYYGNVVFRFPHNNPTLVQIMAWCRTGEKPLPMMQL